MNVPFFEVGLLANHWLCLSPTLSSTRRPMYIFQYQFVVVLLKLMYNLNFSLDKTSVCHLYFSKQKRQQVTMCWNSVSEKAHHRTSSATARDCRPHTAKICLTWLAQLSWCCSSASLLHSVYTFQILLSIFTRCRQNATVANLCLHMLVSPDAAASRCLYCYWLQEST